MITTYFDCPARLTAFTLVSESPATAGTCATGYEVVALDDLGCFFVGIVSGSGSVRLTTSEELARVRSAAC